MARQRAAYERSLHGPAMICAVLANVHDSSGRKWAPSDFLAPSEGNNNTAGIRPDDDFAEFDRRMSLLANICGGTITEE